MSLLSRQQRVDLFQFLFRGREDVFAVRWQKAGADVSGYTPVFTDRSKTVYKSIMQSDIENHLLGTVTIGTYPLLKDNTSCFIVADFDKKNWKRDVKAFHDTCKRHNLPVVLEISRSGNGAHVWCFFDEPYFASKSRKIFLSILRETGHIDDYSHDQSFDRLFPNQDMHSGKGLGNLIALPLQGRSRKENRTVFVSPDTLLPFSDQWNFLASLERVSKEQLDKLYETFCQSDVSPNQPNEVSVLTYGSLRIEMSDMLRIPKQCVPPMLITFLREELNFFNSEYIAKSKIGFSTHGIEKFFKTVSIDDDFVYVPRGYIQKLASFLREKAIPFEVIERRVTRDAIALDKNLELYGYQQEAVESFANKDQGILVAPPGSGKTIMGLAMALTTKQPTLILTHRQNILEQWIDSTHNFLGISKKEIGKYSGTSKKIKLPFAVAMMQSLSRAENKDEILKQFGCVIVDECHHVPAKMFREVVSHVSSKYLFGLTATPKRKYNDEKLITAYLGEIVHEVPGACPLKGSESKGSLSDISVTFLKSGFSVPYAIPSKDFSHLHKLLSFDIGRNAIIADATRSEVLQKRKVLVIAERKEHLEALVYFLKKNVDVITMTGTLSALQKRYRTTRIKNGTFQVVLATGQFFGEGVDVVHFDSLFLVSPHSFEGKLIQYIGRLRRGHTERRVFDIRDPLVEILEKCFKKRMRVYNRMVREGELSCVKEAGALL